MQKDQPSLTTFSKTVLVSEAEYPWFQGMERALHRIFLPPVLSV